MHSASRRQCRIATANLKIHANTVPWDTNAFGFPVAHIDLIEIIKYQEACNDWEQFQQWINSANIRLLSCRLPHDQLNHSLFLEDKGFRFIEMILRPQLTQLQQLSIPNNTLMLASASEQDLPELIDIAENAFHHERYHIDPRLDKRSGNVRYGAWVRSSFCHPTQHLLKFSDQGRIFGFFIIEYVQAKSVYWHLTAIAPKWQGLGYGAQAWNTALAYFQAQGIESVETAISARNSKVLNLYAKLNFRFLPPAMTFHYITFP